jgi:hypothetical protein
MHRLYDVHLTVACDVPYAGTYNIRFSGRVNNVHALT